MGDLSQNFDRSEFACRGFSCCGGVAPIDSRFIFALQALRDILSLEFYDSFKGIHINSGFRCIPHNIEINGSYESTHLDGIAADVVPLGVPTSTLAAFASYIPDLKLGGIALHSSFVHLDIRKDGPARWGIPLNPQKGLKTCLQKNGNGNAP